MATEQYANVIVDAGLGQTTLNGGIDNVVVSIVVNGFTGFPSTAQYRIRIDNEIMLVTAGAGTNTWTVTRGAEGTTAASHSNGATVTHVLTRDGLKGVGGSIILQGTHAARPAAGVDGRVYLPTDGIFISRDDGSNWHPYGPILPLTGPADPGTWVNQDSATLTQTSGGLYLFAPKTNPDGLHLRVKSIPSSPYTLTMGFIPLLQFVDFIDMGLALRDSATGKIVTLSIVSNSFVFATQPIVSVFKWTDPDNFSATYTTTPAPVRVTDWQYGGCMWFRFVDDNTDRHAQVSNDGINFQTIHSVGRTDFLTPDQFGFYARASGTVADSGIMVISLKES